MIEEDLVTELKALAIARILAMLKEEGELGDFVDFAKEQAKKDGMDTKDFMEFLDTLKEMDDEIPTDTKIDWKQIIEVLREQGLKFQCFGGDKSIMIENKEIDKESCANVVLEDEVPLNIFRLNKSLEECGVYLEYIEAIKLPFDLDGFQDFIRFEVKEL